MDRQERELAYAIQLTPKTIILYNTIQNHEAYALHTLYKTISANLSGPAVKVQKVHMSRARHVHAHTIFNYQSVYRSVCQMYAYNHKCSCTTGPCAVGTSLEGIRVKMCRSALMHFSVLRLLGRKSGLALLDWLHWLLHLWHKILMP